MILQVHFCILSEICLLSDTNSCRCVPLFISPHIQGLGLKIFGGVSSRGDEHGIFVKQVVPGGLAALSGRLQAGDELLEVRDLHMVLVAIAFDISNI